MCFFENTDPNGLDGFVKTTAAVFASIAAFKESVSTDQS